PVITVVEGVERRLAEALGSSMAQEHQAVVGLDPRWIVDELEGRDGPRVDAGAPHQILTDQRAVVTGPGADQKDAGASRQPREDGRWKGISQQSLNHVWLRLKSLVQKRAQRLQAASSQALRNW